MDDTSMLPRFVSILFFGVIFALAWNFIARDVEPEPNFKCTFVASPDAAAIRLGELQGPIARIGVAGYLGDPFEERLYDFEGRASIKVDGRPRSFLARGSIFIWEPGKVGDLVITLSSDEYARRDFTLITFDKHGPLSKEPSVAFAFEDPELKLLHPMRYRCSFVGPLPKPTGRND